MLKQYQKGLTGHILTLKIQTYLETTHYSSDSEDSDDEIPLAQQKHEFFKKLRVKLKVKITDHTAVCMICGSQLQTSLYSPNVH